MFGKGEQNLQLELAGLVFPNPVGIPYQIHKRRFNWLHKAPDAGFFTLNPPQENVLAWIKGLTSEPESRILAVNISSDIIRTYSLVYDFADFIIVDPDSDQGIDAADISDTHSLLDELVSLRLWHGLSPEELENLLGTCQLNGLDGVVIPSLAMLSRVREITLGRLPIICSVKSAEEGLEALREGAVLVELPSKKCLNTLLDSLENTSEI